MMMFLNISIVDQILLTFLLGPLSLTPERFNPQIPLIIFDLFAYS